MNKEDLQKEIMSNKYVLVDFFATWCMPCKMQSQIIADIKEQGFEDLTIVKVDVDDSEGLVGEYKIVSVPTLVMYKDGEIIKRYVGVAKEEDILSWKK